MEDTQSSEAAPTGEVIDNVKEGRFEIHLGDRVGFLSYRRAPGRITLIHTEVPDEISGHGVGSRLVRHALEFARREHLRVVIVCPFVREYVDRHPEYQDLLKKQSR